MIAYSILLCFPPDLCPQCGLGKLASKLILAPLGRYKSCRWSHIISRHQKAVVDEISLHAVLYKCMCCAQLQIAYLIPAS